jgi:hypothetical protein
VLDQESVPEKKKQKSQMKENYVQKIFKKYSEGRLPTFQFVEVVTYRGKI